MADALTPEYARLHARVPEHSPGLMSALSGGSVFFEGSYMFVADGAWLAAIGYPLTGSYSHSDFGDALGRALERTGAGQCWAIGPDMPPHLSGSIIERDRFYVLSVRAGQPRGLRGPISRLAERLTVSEGDVFTPEHRRLWAEFTGDSMRGAAAPMSGHVSGLYARTPAAVAAGGGTLRLLDARDGSGRLVASLLLDYGPCNFVSYVLGAHSRECYVPHATDMLFWHMLDRARGAGRRFVHLGLGVNAGILRFKLKWGVRPQFPFVMAAWDALPSGRAAGGMAGAIAGAILRAPRADRVALAERPSQRPLAMLWELEKNGRKSWIAGTAHFFCHSFEDSFRSLYRNVDHVLFEGPLDDDFMARVDSAGKPGPGELAPLAGLLEEDDVRRLERVVRGPRGGLWRLLGMESGRDVDVRWYLANARPWCAFFSLWTAFLERRGWRESVDMEAWNVALDMGKNIVPMESFEEQLDSLDSLPVERVVRFFRGCASWGAYARRNMRSYLAGDLEGMMGSSAEFPTRTEYVVSRRDHRFLERMLPYVESGRCAVFVGAAHMINLRGMLAEAGFAVRQAPFGLWPSLRARARRWRGSDVTW